MNISITHAGLYTTPEKHTQHTTCVFLGLFLSGVEYMKIYSPDGVLAGELSDQTMFLVPPGFKLDFSYRASRKNYIIICQIREVNWNTQRNCVELDFNGQKIEVPLILPTPPIRREQIQETFQRIVQLSKSALPADTKAAEMLMLSILSEFLEHTGSDSKQKIPDILIKFKNAIDSDTSFKKSLSSIMEEFNISKIHLRRLFQKYYQTSPAEYRSRMRFSKIQELLTHSDLSFKEIADEVGMNHVTHLYLFLKKYCGTTPVKLRKNLKM